MSEGYIVAKGPDVGRYLAELPSSAILQPDGFWLYRGQVLIRDNAMLLWKPAFQELYARLRWFIYQPRKVYYRQTRARRLLNRFLNLPGIPVSWYERFYLREYRFMEDPENTWFYVPRYRDCTLGANGLTLLMNGEVFWWDGVVGWCFSGSLAIDSGKVRVANDRAGWLFELNSVGHDRSVG